jgi:DNA invertase Pin-like site-specific DNA recombinase
MTEPGNLRKSDPVCGAQSVEAQSSGAQAGLYARVSTSKQDLDLQLEELHRLAIRRGWAVASEYTDIISGASRRRHGLDRLLADGHSGRLAVVVVWKLDRLGRSLIHMVQVVDDLLGKGVHVVSATEPHMDSTTPQGRLMRNILGSMAEYERELIRERIRAGLERARAKGVRLGRRPRLVDLEEVRRRRAAGQGWHQIARALKTPAPDPSPTVSGGPKSPRRIEARYGALGGGFRAGRGGCLNVRHSATATNAHGPLSVELLDRFTPSYRKSVVVVLMVFRVRRPRGSYWKLAVAPGPLKQRRFRGQPFSAYCIPPSRHRHSQFGRTQRQMR